jgi:hypothetical protein
VAAAEAAVRGFEAQSPAEVQATESAYLTALAGLDAAQAALRDAERPPAAALAAGQAAVAQTRAAFQSAEATRAALSEGSTPQSPCFRTSNGLTFDRDESPLDAVACDAAESAAEQAVGAASATVAVAEQQLDQVRAGGSPALRAQLAASVKQAQADVATSKAQLDAFHSGAATARRDALLDRVVVARASHPRFSRHTGSRGRSECGPRRGDLRCFRPGENIGQVGSRRVQRSSGTVHCALGGLMFRLGRPTQQLVKASLIAAQPLARRDYLRFSGFALRIERTTHGAVQACLCRRQRRSVAHDPKRSAPLAPS